MGYNSYVNEKGEKQTGKSSNGKYKWKNLIFRYEPHQKKQTMNQEQELELALEEMLDKLYK